MTIHHPLPYQPPSSHTPPLSTTQHQTIKSIIHTHRPSLTPTKTSTNALVGGHLSALGLKVHTSIGGHGVVGTFSNPNPSSSGKKNKTVLLRSELDALPILEQSAVPFASKKRGKDEFGVDLPIMHACGHDMHLTCLLAATKLLVKAAEAGDWKAGGNLIVVFQPDEEHLGGAKRMVEGIPGKGGKEGEGEALFDVLEKEEVENVDVVLAQHSAALKAGMVGIQSGPVLASATRVDVRIWATKGYKVNPQVGVEVNEVATGIVLGVKKVVEGVREEYGGDEYAGVRTLVFQGGRDGDDVVEWTDLVLDVKVFDELLKEVLKRIREFIEKECKDDGCAKTPDIKFSVRAPLTDNDSEAAGTLKKAFEGYFGEDKINNEVTKYPVEDSSLLARKKNIPYCFWFLGAKDPELWDELEGKSPEERLDRMPGGHSPFNVVPIEQTLRTGMDALACAALTFFYGVRE